jgi:hypothetical protein
VKKKKRKKEKKRREKRIGRKSSPPAQNGKPLHSTPVIVTASVDIGST